ncbi:MAG: DedA family protein [Candidatus Dormibacter sp.]|uniref:DedA family protein n=1 Tax=Candidatus Dormibacter sp. TaxID=2973982 RepID=UPI0026BBFABA
MLRRRLLPFGLPLAIALLVIAIALLEGDLPEAVRDITRAVRGFVNRAGPIASIALLYVEESGVPLPVPGDVYVIYLGHQAGFQLLKWVGAWLAVITAVTAGATNMYLIARRWGRRLVKGRLGVAIHLNPERLHKAEGWFQRWGALAIIFGRHVPGMRIPITVASGIFQVHYPTFAGSVAVSTAIWAGVWLFLGARYGGRVSTFLGHHAWTTPLFIAGVLLLGLYVGVRALRAKPEEAAELSAE